MMALLSTAYVAELVYQNSGADDGVVVDHHLTGKLRRVADNQVVAKHTVVGHMHVLHQEAVVAHYRGALRSRTAGDGHILTDAVRVAYLAETVLTLELQVLGLGRYARAGEKLVAVADTGTVVYRHTVVKMVVVAYNRVAVDIAERAYHIVVAQLGFRMHKGHGAYGIHRLSDFGWYSS